MRPFLLCGLLLAAAPSWGMVLRVPARVGGQLNPMVSVYGTIQRAVLMQSYVPSLLPSSPGLVPSISPQNQAKFKMLMHYSPIPDLAPSALPLGTPAGTVLAHEDESDATQQDVSDALSTLTAVNDALDKVSEKDLQDPHKAAAIIDGLWSGIQSKTAERSLMGVVRAKGENDDADTLKALEWQAGTGEADGFIHSLRAKEVRLLGRGSESLVIELETTPHLMETPSFAEVITSMIEDNANLRARLFEDLPEEVRDDLGREGIFGPVSSGRLTRLLTDHLPKYLVVKLVHPSGGSWGTDWGFRSFDSPVLAKVELEDGITLIIQEKLDMVSSGGAQSLEQRLGKDWEFVDPGIDPQVGIDSHGRLVLADYSAVGRPGEDEVLVGLTNPKALRASREQEALKDTSEHDIHRRGFVLTDIELRARRQQAMDLEGIYSSLSPAEGMILVDLLQDMGDAATITEDAVNDAITMRALLREEYPDLGTATQEVLKILEMALKDGLVSR